ncbi:hypothetical protein IA57_06860 [Mangrovimonas yunxiaonensis]|uniref:Uncharacterized protein n=2 Tax=Mangrovimonas yunxiaonensis TaxID=1197477 RepID=A0A084TLF7_9FLAO|nr:hypothetical protein IA57_06860 [Mangrovimonas yunxiaonensis]GGH36069.1 hypothetical protein GCM10011364_03060 [Mangrovimonas yunxiaonensis]
MLSTPFLFSQKAGESAQGMTSVTTSRGSGDARSFIVSSINNHGYYHNSFKWKLKASFEGSYLGIVPYNPQNNKVKEETMYCDFSNLYTSGNVDVRSNNLAFINIYVASSRNINKKKWKKEKLVIRVDNPEIAKSLLDAFQDLNRSLR